MVSSSVRPVNTRMVICFSCAVRVPHDGMSLDTGTFSGSQKFPVSRSQTSASFSSCSRFQLIAETRSISFMFSVTETPLHPAPLAAGLVAVLGLQTLPLGSDKAGQHNTLCFPCREGRQARGVCPVELAGGQRRRPVGLGALPYPVELVLRGLD